MHEMRLFRMDRLSVVEIHGNDACTIAHNLTTQAIRDLPEGHSTETFVTDVKGKMVGHVIVLKDKDCLRLIGPSGQSQAIAEHIDRYIIREDATVSVHDDEYSGLVISSALADAILEDHADTNMVSDEKHTTQQSSANTRTDHRQQAHTILINQKACWTISVPWLSGKTPSTTGVNHSHAHLVLVPKEETEKTQAWISSTYPCTQEDEDAFHRQRTYVGFPWFGIDLNQSNLPQEADRDSQTISFTKGCYLGQETIARLDAMGQVQKKLVRWQIEGDRPEPGATVTAEEKTVGRLTSVAEVNEGIFAIGPARRTHFDPGSIGTVTANENHDPSAGSPTATATVIE